MPDKDGTFRGIHISHVPWHRQVPKPKGSVSAQGKAPETSEELQRIIAHAHPLDPDGPEQCCGTGCSRCRRTEKP